MQPEQLDDIFENGTTIGTPSEQECFARCKKNQCCMLQYSVTLKACRCVCVCAGLVACLCVWVGEGGGGRRARLTYCR